MKCILFILIISLPASAQGIKVEYDKNRDHLTYKTFRFGESEIVTPGDQKQVSDETINQWVTEAIAQEFTGKGLKLSDSASDLVVTYVIGTFAHTDMQQLGPLGTSPGSSSQIWTRDYRQGDLIIDVNESNTQTRIWRVSAVADASGPMPQRIIESIVREGFRKFYIPNKAKRKKKK